MQFAKLSKIIEIRCCVFKNGTLKMKRPGQKQKIGWNDLKGSLLMMALVILAEPLAAIEGKSRCDDFLDPFLQSSSDLQWIPNDQKRMSYKIGTAPGTQNQTRRNLFSHEGWKFVTKASLLKHIVSAHFQARTLRDFGIALYDVEMAAYRGFRLQAMVDEALRLIARSDEDILEEIRSHAQHDRIRGEFSIDEYRLVLIKNIKLAEIFDRIQYDPAELEKFFPGASSVRVDFKKDSRDGSFFEINGPDLDIGIVEHLELKKKAYLQSLR
jgi:hypothetical protein